MPRLSLLAAAAALAMTVPAFAETQHFKASLTGAAETPPNDSKGMGEATVAFDPATKLLIWSIDYMDLSGPATMAHFHGPAAPGVAAGVEVNIPAPLASPIKGSTVLTDAQAGDLEAGKLYINIHTPALPKGEIRGQVEAAK
jgi:hypothetical protein